MSDIGWAAHNASEANVRSLLLMEHRERKRLEARLAAAEKDRDEYKEIAENCCKPAMAALLLAEKVVEAARKATVRHSPHDRDTNSPECFACDLSSALSDYARLTEEHERKI